MIRTYLFLGVLAGGLALAPAASMASQWRACTTQAPTPASYTWNFRHEASQLLHQVQADAQGTKTNADMLRIDIRDPMTEWHEHLLHLSNISDNIDEMDKAVCRLESIRRVVTPEQQQKIGEAVVLVREISINADDAVRFLREHRETLWMPAYHTYAMSMFVESQQLADTLKKPVG